MPAALMGSSQGAPWPHGACTALMWSGGSSYPERSTCLAMFPSPPGSGMTRIPQQLGQLPELLERPLALPHPPLSRRSEGIPQTVSQKIFLTLQHPCSFRMCGSGTASLFSATSHPRAGCALGLLGPHKPQTGSSQTLPIPGVVPIQRSGSFVSHALGHIPHPHPQEFHAESLTVFPWAL